MFWIALGTGGIGQSTKSHTHTHRSKEKNHMIEEKQRMGELEIGMDHGWG